MTPRLVDARSVPLGPGGVPPGGCPGPRWKKRCLGPHGRCSHTKRRCCLCFGRAVLRCISLPCSAVGDMKALGSDGLADRT